MILVLGEKNLLKITLISVERVRKRKNLLISKLKKVKKAQQLKGPKAKKPPKNLQKLTAANKPKQPIFS